jgi:hypothetical protein
MLPFPVFNNHAAEQTLAITTVHLPSSRLLLLPQELLLEICTYSPDIPKHLRQTCREAWVKVKDTFRQRYFRVVNINFAMNIHKLREIVQNDLGQYIKVLCLNMQGFENESVLCATEKWDHISGIWATYNWCISQLKLLEELYLIPMELGEVSIGKEAVLQMRIRQLLERIITQTLEAVPCIRKIMLQKIVDTQVLASLPLYDQNWRPVVNHRQSPRAMREVKR